jgi:hypothetical protein
LVDSVFLYNYYYSHISTFDWKILIKGYNYMAFLVQLGLLGLMGVITTLFLQWKSDSDKARFALLMLLVFPIQLYLSILSGRRYMHYYIAWLPPLAFLTGFLIFGIKQVLLKVFQNFRYNTLLHPLAAFMLIVAFGLTPVINRMPALLYLCKNIVSELHDSSPNYTATKENAHIEYILNHTQASDYVLIWGNEAFYNFITEREAPSRFVYTYAFGTPGYVSQEMADELLYSIIEKRPMIIDATAHDNTVLGILSEKWKRFPITQNIMEYIKKNYIISDSQFGPDKWDVWIYKGD